MKNIREKIIEYMLFSLLGATLFVPSTVDVFANSVVYLFVVIIFLFWILNCYPRYSTALNLPLLCFLLYSLISLARTSNLHFTLMQIYMLISCYLLFLMVINIFNKKNSIDRFIFFFLFIGGLKMLQVIIRYFFPDNIGASWCFFLPTMPNNNHLSGYLVMMILVALGVLWFKEVKKGVKVCMILYIITGFLLVFLTNSRAGLIALFFPLLMLLYMKNKKFFVVGLFIIPLMLIYCFFFLKIGSGFKRGDPNAYERLTVWGDSMKLFSDYPVLGSGLGTFRDYYPQYKSMEGTRSTQYAHNEYLNILVEMGILGFIVFLWITVKLFREITHRRLLYPGIFAAICSVLIQAGVEFNLHNVAITFPICFFVGIIIQKKEYNLYPIHYLIKIGVAIGVLCLIFLFSLPVVGVQLYNKSQIFFKEGNNSDAQKYALLSIAVDSTYGLYHMKLGDIYWAKGMFLEALNEFETAVELENRNVWYRRNLAQKYLRLNMLDKAISEYARMIRLAPNVYLFQDEIKQLYKLKSINKTIK